MLAGHSALSPTTTTTASSGGKKELRESDERVHSVGGTDCLLYLLRLLRVVLWSFFSPPLCNLIRDLDGDDGYPSYTYPFFLCCCFFFFFFFFWVPFFSSSSCIFGWCDDDDDDDGGLLFLGLMRMFFSVKKPCVSAAFLAAAMNCFLCNNKPPLVWIAMTRRFRFL